MLDTVCKECIFAEYENDTQISCSKHKIEKFRKIGEEILECYDEDKEFFVIKNRKCPLYRTKTWVDNIGSDNIEEQLSREKQLSFDCVIFLKDKSLDLLRNTINSLNNQLIKPVSITIICSSKNHANPTDIKSIMPENCIRWKLDNKIIDTVDDKSIMLQKYNKQNIITIINCGHIMPINYFSSINDVIVEKLVKVLLVNESWAQTISSHAFHHMYHNVKECSVIERLVSYQKQTEEKYIYTYKEILECAK